MSNSRPKSTARAKARKRRAQLKRMAPSAGWDSGGGSSKGVGVGHSRATRPVLRSGRWRGKNTLEELDAWVADMWTVRGTAIALVLSICAAAVFSFFLWQNERERDAYNSASFCVTALDTGCKLELPATIKDRGETGGKAPSYYLDLTGTPPADGRFFLPDETTLWDSASAGDPVTAIVWKGAVDSIVDGAAAGDTDTAPARGAAIFGAVFASAIVWILTSAALLIRIAEVDRGAGAGWSRRLVPFNAVAIGGSLFFPIAALAGSQWDETITTGIIAGAGLTGVVAIYMFVVWFVSRRRNR